MHTDLSTQDSGMKEDKSMLVDTLSLTQDDGGQPEFEGTYITRSYSFKPKLKSNTRDIIYFANDHRLYTLVPVLTIPKENEGKKPFFRGG